MWYISVGLYLYDPYILQIIYWPLHTHDIEIDVVESTVDWQYYIDKYNKDLERGVLYVEEWYKNITIRKRKQKYSIIDDNC